MLNAKVEYKVKGYANRWSVIDTYKGYALLENNTYGDETCCLVVSEDVKVENKKYKVNGEEKYLPTIMEVVDEIYDNFRENVDEVYSFVPYDFL